MTSRTAASSVRVLAAPVIFNSFPLRQSVRSLSMMKWSSTARKGEPKRLPRKQAVRVNRPLVLFFLCAYLAAPPKPQSAKIGKSAVWQAPQQFMTTAQAACDRSPSSTHGECMIAQMEKAGAPADAVRFTRELYDENHGEFGFMTGFQEASPVSIAWITYPLRANTNYGLLVVNGKPRIVNLEDLKLLDAKAMKSSPGFQDLKAQFPNVDVWPGDRDGKTWPNSQTGPGGGIQFTVSYPLINGCHACAHAGFVIFNWNFDASGRFLRTTFQGIINPPLP